MEDQSAKELQPPTQPQQDEVEVSLEATPPEEEIAPSDRILSIVTNPRRAFEGLPGGKTGKVSIISLVVAILLTGASIVARVGTNELFQKTIERDVEKIEKMRDDPAMSTEKKEALDKQIELMRSMSPLQYMLFGGLLGSILGVPFFALIIGLVVFTIAKILERDRTTRIGFGHAFAVASLAGVVSSLGGVIVAGVILATGNPSLTLRVGDLIQANSPTLSTLLTIFSLPFLWWIYVTGLGIATIARREPLPAMMMFGGVVLVFATLIGFITEKLAFM